MTERLTHGIIKIMTDTMQLLLVGVITVLTIILSVIGIQIVYILKEFRRVIEKVNKILADAGRASEKMSDSLAEIAGITSGIKAVLGIFNLFSKRKEKKEGDE